LLLAKKIAGPEADAAYWNYGPSPMLTTMDLKETSTESYGCKKIDYWKFPAKSIHCMIEVS
jgi:hypothetical protein